EYTSNPAPDNDMFQHLARTYAQNHPVMHQGVGCERDGRTFKEGIVNGANWYPFAGSMADYSYVQGGSLELTLEISCCKHPPQHTLRQFWAENIRPLIRLMEEIHRGVKGIISDDQGGPIGGARMVIKERQQVAFHTSPRGEFWRILLPGSYTLLVSAEGYQTTETPFTIVEGHSAVLNITLKALHHPSNYLIGDGDKLTGSATGEHHFGAFYEPVPAASTPKTSTSWAGRLLSFFNPSRRS
ncbi:carboxypeptidase M-like, partial [Tropilaelaps mercedesae]